MASMSDKISPLAPAAFPTLKPIAGVRLSATEAGIRYKNRVDLMVADAACCGQAR